MAPAVQRVMFDPPNGNIPFSASQKRARVEDLEESQEEDAGTVTKINQEKRVRYGRPEISSNIQPRHLEVHRVSCEGGDNHARHKQVSDFIDVPRLFAGDSKANGLRGRRPLPNVEEHLETHPEICLVVYKTYNCNEYHAIVKEQFDSLPIPKLDPDVLAQLRPYFFTLKQDEETARPIAEEMTIISDDLKEAITSIAANYPERFGNWQDQPNLRAPYLHFYHCRAVMRDASDDILDGNHQSLIKVLLDYLQTSFGSEYEEADAMFARGLVSQRHFHKLFGPNEVVVTTKNGQPLAFVSETYPEPDQSPINLDCWSWTFDGFFQQEKTTQNVQWLLTTTQTIPIKQLNTCPLRYDSTGLERRLRDRGGAFWSCRRRRYVSYESPNPTFEVQATNPRYMIDLATYRQMHTDENHPPQRDDLEPGAMDEEEPPDDSFALLLPANILGFGFHDKKWRQLSVEHINPVQWNKKAFERLVLTSQKKELVKALVTVHVKTSSSTDVIEGKGNGLIILLHGGPGTGKTLTAESVAELAEKPLYRVTCGDIGTDAEGVEKYLESVLYIGTIWSCVVLLDEADVFLEERTQTDLQRNALVSVFLRVLEYYEGILILTSNRVGTFDEAFKSRVQLAMHYPSLEKDGRLEIWNTFIKDLRKNTDEVNYDGLMDRIDILARHKLNGRQIRNTVKTARQLAYFRKEKLEYSHFEVAIGVANEFEEYVEKTHGHTDEEWVRSQRTRY